MRGSINTVLQQLVGRETDKEAGSAIKRHAREPGGALCCPLKFLVEASQQALLQHDAACTSTPSSKEVRHDSATRLTNVTGKPYMTTVAQLYQL